MSGDQISIGAVSGEQNQIGGRGNTYNVGAGHAAPGSLAAAGPRNEQLGGAPVNSLHAFADIVGYSGLSARLQEESQERLHRVLHRSLTEAGIRPEAVTAQDQGDARLLTFPVDTDVAKVLAVMPRYLYGELLARNHDMAPHAHLRVRLSFTMGTAGPGQTGLTGQAPIAVVRLSNSACFRRAMAAAPQSSCGVIIDDHLHHGYVRQDFRPDMDAEEYVPVHVSEPEKGFEAAAWLRLFGCSSRHLQSLIG
jgi:hypothetical protein